MEEGDSFIVSELEGVVSHKRISLINTALLLHQFLRNFTAGSSSAATCMTNGVFWDVTQCDSCKK
jgi:hypothetical protein